MTDLFEATFGIKPSPGGTAPDPHDPTVRLLWATHEPDGRLRTEPVYVVLLPPEGCDKPALLLNRNYQMIGHIPQDAAEARIDEGVVSSWLRYTGGPRPEGYPEAMDAFWLY